MVKKAQAGIGTLIIFIAMIIVASITANVLVQTATSLQNQALKTGKQAQEGISTMARATRITATNGTNHNLEDYRVQLKLVSGSNGIDLTKVLLSFETSSYSTNYIYSNESCQNSSTNGYFTNSTAHNGTFTLRYLVEGNKYKKGYLQRGDIIELCFASEESVSEDREVTIRIEPDIGMSTIVSFVTTDVITNYLEILYP